MAYSKCSHFSSLLLLLRAICSYIFPKMYSFHKFISDFSFRRKFFGAVIVTLAYRNAQKRSVAARKRDR